jgi:hypothetical protein
MMKGNGFWSDFTAWAKQPFSVDMPLFPDFFLLVGVFIVFAIIWNILLRHLMEALENA